MSIENSQSLFIRSQKLAPGGVHSPVRAFRSVGGTPIFFQKGSGAYLWDEDGNKYLDFCMSWGALALGHAHPAVVDAVKTQAEKGTHFGTPTKLDVELAELALSALAPFEMIRFVNSGTEAVMTAVRLARGISGRSKIVKIDGAYHGHLDSMLVNAGSGLITQGDPSSAGVPNSFVKETLTAPYNDVSSLEKIFSAHGNDIAAIIVEPVMANNGLFEFSKDYFEAVGRLKKKYQCLLIFDEVITGFRVGWGGAKKLYNMDPDIGTYGKILGGGMPVGAIAASRSVMENIAPTGKVYQAGTLSGNPIAMAAGIANLKTIASTNYYEKVEALGKYLDQKVIELRSKLDPFYYKRVAGIFWLCPGMKQPPGSPNDIGQASKDAYKVSFHRLLNKGIYTAPSVFEVGFLSSAHTTSDIDFFVNALMS